MIRDIFLAYDLAHVAVKIEGLHGDQIDHAFQIFLESDGNLEQDRVKSKFIPDLVYDAIRIGAGPVAFIDKSDTRHPVPGHLSIYGNSLGLHAAHGTENQYSAVKHP